EPQARAMRRLCQRLERVPLVRRRIDDVVARDLRVEDSEPVVMLRRDHHVLHPGVLGDAHPFIGIEPRGVEAVDELLVVRDGDVTPAHDPFADAGDALALIRTGRDGVSPPVDEHPEARVAPPVHAGVALSRRFVGDVLGARWVETAGAANNQYEDADTAKRHVISSVYYHS